MLLLVSQSSDLYILTRVQFILTTIYCTTNVECTVSQFKDDGAKELELAD